MTREVLHHAGNRMSRGAGRIGLAVLGLMLMAVPVRAEKANAYPTWAEFPALPQNVPSTTEIRAQVKAIYGREQDLLAQVAAIDWERIDPARFSLGTIARLDSELSQPVTENIRDAANRFAAEQAARAVPPPLID